VAQPVKKSSKGFPHERGRLRDSVGSKLSRGCTRTRIPVAAYRGMLKQIDREKEKSLKLKLDEQARGRVGKGRGGGKGIRNLVRKTNLAQHWYNWKKERRKRKRAIKRPMITRRRTGQNLIHEEGRIKITNWEEEKKRVQQSTIRARRRRNFLKRLPADKQGRGGLG